MNLGLSNIFSGVLFGSIGFSAFLYGKKRDEWRPMIIGGVLMGFPYLVTNTLAQYVIGTILTIALFVFR